MRITFCCFFEHGRTVAEALRERRLGGFVSYKVVKKGGVRGLFWSFKRSFFEGLLIKPRITRSWP